MKPFIYVDERNSLALAAAGKLSHYPLNEATVILVFGGDGTMIKAVHSHFDKGLPFYGINYGHLGFLLNDEKADSFLHGGEYKIFELPLLDVEWSTLGMGAGKTIAMNDAWVERATSQTARLMVHVDGQCRLKSLYADALLMATPQGSTAYARSMGGVPLPLNTKTLQLVGSNVAFPNWKYSLLGLDQTVDIRVREPEKRPVRLYADGLPKASNVAVATIKKSTTHSAVLIFDVGKDLAEKIAKIQFPE